MCPVQGNDLRQQHRRVDSRSPALGPGAVPGPDLLAGVQPCPHRRPMCSDQRRRRSLRGHRPV